MAGGSNFVKLVGYGSFLDTMESGAEAFSSVGEPTFIVGTNVHYGLYQEYGTYKMAAQPFLRPATDQVRRKMGNYFDTNATPRGALRAAAGDLASEAQRRAPVDSGKLRASLAPPVESS